MPTITYIEADGTKHHVDLEVGRSLMEGARDNGVKGITADCGGACACSTCHLYIDEAWLAKMPNIEEIEADMLDFASHVRPQTSRLGCQIRMNAQLEGLVLHVPGP